MLIPDMLILRNHFTLYSTWPSIRMRIFLIISIILISCTKENDTVVNGGILLRIKGKTLCYYNVTIKEEAFCRKNLFSISADGNLKEELLISVVTDSLQKGTFNAGLNYWGTLPLTNNITLNVLSYKDGLLNATFNGSIISGEIRNVLFYEK
jgi:hypothetical protein